MNEKKDSQLTSIAVDTGVLVEFLEDSILGKKFSQKVLENPQVKIFYISPLVDTELKYIFCRRSGFQNAIKYASEFLKDFIIYSESELRDEAYHLKCKFPISIADCYSLAIGKIRNIPVYMKKEEEIDKVLEELLSVVKIIYIDNVV